MRIVTETLKRLTDLRWLNLFEVEYEHSSGATGKWQFASRRPHPALSLDPLLPDAVFIVPLLQTPQGKRLVMTREFRVPLGDYEYSCPAGLIETGENIETTIHRELAEETGLALSKILAASPVTVTSAGLADETVVIAFVECMGTPHTRDVDGLEEIEVLILDYEEVCRLRTSSLKLSAKAWLVLMMLDALGRIDWPERLCPKKVSGTLEQVDDPLPDDNPKVPDTFFGKSQPERLELP
jgi:ADP-ribose pyrophosphatase